VEETAFWTFDIGKQPLVSSGINFKPSDDLVARGGADENERTHLFLHTELLAMEQMECEWPATTAANMNGTL